MLRRPMGAGEEEPPGEVPRWPRGILADLEVNSVGAMPRGLLVAASFLMIPGQMAGSDARGVCHGTAPPRRMDPRFIDLLDRCPLSFEANRGQAERGAAFLARGNGWTAALLSDGIRFALPGLPGECVTLRIRGGAARGTLLPAEPLESRSHFLLGDDPSRWITDVPHYASVLAAGVLPGVGVRWRGLPRGRLRYDLEFSPGSDPGAVALSFEGVTGLGVDEDGSLVVDAPWGSMRHSVPRAWQTTEQGATLAVPCRFVVEGYSVRFALAGLDPALPLVIDPTVLLSTKFGGGTTRAYGCAVDPSGNVYLTGFTSVDQSGTAGAYQQFKSTSQDAFVAKFASGSSSYSYFTYLGGDSEDRPSCIAVDPSGAAYIAGITYSLAFPQANRIQNRQSTPDAFVAKIGPTGGTLPYSSYLGGTDFDECQSIAVDWEGGAWVGGRTHSSDFPLVRALNSTLGPGVGFLARVLPAGGTLDFSTFLGGTEYVKGIAVAGDGNVWAVGSSASSSLTTVSPLQGTFGGGVRDAFVAEVTLNGATPDGPELLYASYLGGSNPDMANAVAVDAFGEVVVAGFTTSSEFPAVAAFQGTLAGGADAFVYRLDPSTMMVTLSSFLGGTVYDEAFGVAVDAAGDIYVGGVTQSTDFPLASATDSSTGGGAMFFTKVSRSGSPVLFSTYHEVGESTLCYGVATDGSVGVAAGWTIANGSDEAALAELQFLPAPMRNFRATEVALTRVGLAWTDPHSGAYAVEVQRKDPGGDFTTVASLATGATSWTDTSVTEGTYYEYRVRGTSGGGPTGWSRLRVVTPLPAPGSVHIVENLNDAVTIGWTDLAGTEVAYDVYRRVGTPQDTLRRVAVLPAGTQQWTDADIAPETYYEYVVRVRGMAGGYTDAAPLILYSAPRDPEDLVLSPVSDIEVYARWTDWSDAETSYEVQRRDDDAGGAFATVETTAADIAEYSDDGLVPERSYTWRVRAVNSWGASYWTNTGSRRTAPSAPTGTVAQATSPEAVDLTWVDTAGEEQGFLLERRGPGEDEFSLVGTPAADETTWEDPGLTQRSTYTYRVRASNENGVSRALVESTVTTPAQIVLTAVTRRPAAGRRPARISFSGWFDSDQGVEGLAGPAEIVLGDATLPISALEGKRGSLRYQDDSLVLDLKGSKGGTSAVTLSLTVSGPAADVVASDGVVRLIFRSGESIWAGGARIAGGVFDWKKGTGGRETPSLTIASLKASIIRPAENTLLLRAEFIPFEVGNAGIPDIRFSLGAGFQRTLEGVAFLPAKKGYLYASAVEGTWVATLDPVGGTLEVKAKHLDLGQFEAGEVPMQIEMTMGDLHFLGTPVLQSNGKVLEY